MLSLRMLSFICVIFLSGCSLSAETLAKSVQEFRRSVKTRQFTISLCQAPFGTKSGGEIFLSVNLRGDGKISILPYESSVFSVNESTKRVLNIDGEVIFLRLKIDHPVSGERPKTEKRFYSNCGGFEGIAEDDSFFFMDKVQSRNLTFESGMLMEYLDKEDKYTVSRADGGGPISLTFENHTVLWKVPELQSKSQSKSFKEPEADDARHKAILRFDNNLSALFCGKDSHGNSFSIYGDMKKGGNCSLLTFNRQIVATRPFSEGAINKYFSHEMFAEKTGLTKLFRLPEDKYFELYSPKDALVYFEKFARFSGSNTRLSVSNISSTKSKLGWERKYYRDKNGDFLRGVTEPLDLPVTLQDMKESLNLQELRASFVPY